MPPSLQAGPGDPQAKERIGTWASKDVTGARKSYQKGSLHTAAYLSTQRTVWRFNQEEERAGPRHNPVIAAVVSNPASNRSVHSSRQMLLCRRNEDEFPIKPYSELKSHFKMAAPAFPISVSLVPATELPK